MLHTWGQQQVGACEMFFLHALLCCVPDAPLQDLAPYISQEVAISG